VPVPDAIAHNAPIRPFLRWAGSKRRQLPMLARHVTVAFDRYVEPFVGSACLFFQLRPNAAVLGDKNKELIEVYRSVRDNPLRLHRRLAAIPRDAATYYRWRALDPRGLDREQRALRFLYLNRNCFNGIYRTNARGHFNVPFGIDVGRYLVREELLACAAALENVQLIDADFEKTLAHVRPGDFVYLDPPFAASSRRIFREYGSASFSPADVPRLAAQLRRIAQLGAVFLVSYADCKEARSLAMEWQSRKVKVRRHVAGFVGDRSHAYEWLISNYQIET
jgi:DNA adenine methylase